jgi:hypothetical protein
MLQNGSRTAVARLAKKERLWRKERGGDEEDPQAKRSHSFHDDLRPCQPHQRLLNRARPPPKTPPSFKGARSLPRHQSLVSASSSRPRILPLTRVSLRPVNVFTNDGSFLTRFKKVDGSGEAALEKAKQEEALNR